MNLSDLALPLRITILQIATIFSQSKSCQPRANPQTHHNPSGGVCKQINRIALSHFET